MRNLAGLASVTLFSLAIAPWMQAQSADDLRLRLRNAATDSAIDTEGLKPWHLKMDVELFDGKGKALENGTVEGWWVARDLNKLTFTFPSYKRSQMHNKDGYFRTKGQPSEPPILEDVVEEVVHPIDLGDLARTTPDLRKEKFGKVELDCIMLDEQLKNVAYPPLGLFPTYCLDPGKTSLRITTELGSVMFLRNSVGRFQERSVAVDFVAQSSGIIVAKAHVNALGTVKASEVDLTPSEEMQAEHEADARISGGVMAGSILNKVPPVYPQSAKARRVQGTVLLHAIIGRDGRVRSLHIVSTPDSDLAMAAIAAVRQWTYQPYLLNGVPTQVDTTITVNFAFGPG